MTSWFRFYGETLNDPKILKLSDNLYRVWVGLLCVASQNNGRLPGPDDLALLLRTTPIKIRAAIEKLMESGLIDEVDTDITPHNWNVRQYKSDVSTDRVKRFRKRERNVSETPPDTDTDTDTEKKEHCPVVKPTRTALGYSEEFETTFWKPYPKTANMSKKEAWREWMKLAPDKRLAACQAIPGYEQHLKRNPTLQTVHACRFLSQERAETILELAAHKPSLRGHFV